jgi:hypothetical protein
MTCCLSLALADLECGGVNRETERLFAYHHGSKHSYRAVRTNAHFLDWHNQSDPDPDLGLCVRPKGGYVFSRDVDVVAGSGSSRTMGYGADRQTERPPQGLNVIREHLWLCGR